MEEYCKKWPFSNFLSQLVLSCKVFHPQIRKGKKKKKIVPRKRGLKASGPPGSTCKNTGVAAGLLQQECPCVSFRRCRWTVQAPFVSCKRAHAHTLIVINSHVLSPGSCPPSAYKITHYSHSGVSQIQLEQLLLLIFLAQQTPENTRYPGMRHGDFPLGVL